MKYFCALCKVAIKRKSARGWTEHSKGAKHINTRSKRLPSVLLDPFLSFLSYLEQKSIITPEESAGVRDRYAPQIKRSELKEIVRNALK